jgi:hypothetical protein
LKQDAIALWLVHQPDKIKEGVIELTNVLIHMGVVYTDFLDMSMLLLLY